MECGFGRLNIKENWKQCLTYATPHRRETMVQTKKFYVVKDERMKMAV